ncbi:hypothetical protein ACQP2F_32350 [Actinoplanes sp. CA-030573]|uniref:hypothetical protein n=1 Tax=Actinoplanes sp. CA-030573 TaxID=3239898 RepID=UPI003D8C4CE6
MLDHLRQLTADAGLPVTRVHDPQHTAPTIMIDQGVPLAVWYPRNCGTGNVAKKAEERRRPVRVSAIPALTCGFLVGLTGFEPATP